MSITAHCRRLIAFFLTAIACTLLAGACSAVSMDVIAGFDGVAKSGTWVPVAVKLSNTGSDTIEGILDVSPADPTSGDISKLDASVSLPPNSTKLYTAYARITDNGDKLRVSLISRGAAAEKLINLSAAPSEDSVVVSVGDRMSRLNFLSGENIPSLWSKNVHYSGGGPASSYSYGNTVSGNSAVIHVGSIPPDALPDRPAAYSGVEVMVVSDLTSSQASPKALKAIGMWVASGGMLVVSASANYKNYLNDFYDEMLPVKITGMASVNSMASLSRMGSSPFPAGAISVAKCEVKRGIGAVVTASESGLPIVVERKYGAGKVVFIAVDHLSPAFRSWNGQIAFWKRIITSPVSDPLVRPAEASDYSHPHPGIYGGGYASSINPSELAKVVAPNPSIKAPSFNTIGIFLLTYFVCLAPVNYWFLKRKRKLEMAWVTTPAIVLLFTLGAYTIGSTMKSGGLQCTEAAFVEASSGCRYASVLRDASLFSPARRSYDLEVADPYSISEVIRSDSREQLPESFVAEKSAIQGVGMAMWSSKFFESRSGVDLGGAVKSDLVISGERVRGKVRNNTPIRFKNCAIVYGSLIQSIGDLGPGDEAEVDIDYKPYTGGNQRNYYPNQADVPVETRLGSLAKNAAKSALCPVLLAGSDPGGSTFNVTNAGAASNPVVCYVFRLNCKAGGAFSIGGKRVARTITQIENGSNQDSDSSAGTASLALNINGSAEIKYHLPVPENAQLTAVTVRASQVSGGKKPFDVLAYNNTAGNYDPVDARSGKGVLNPGNYVTPSGEVSIKVQVKPGQQCSMWVAVSAQGKPR